MPKEIKFKTVTIKVVSGMQVKLAIYTEYVDDKGNVMMASQIPGSPMTVDEGDFIDIDIRSVNDA